MYVQCYVNGHTCLNFFILIFFVIRRHIYVVDLFDHNVHVLERKEDNALVLMKVNYKKKFIERFRNCFFISV